MIYFFQAIYIIYMLNWFKTTWNFAHPASKFTSDYFAHPVNKLEFPINPVCKLGNNLSWVFAFYLIARGIYLKSINNSHKLKIANTIHIFILIFSFFLSLLNFNVTIYLLPIIILELFMLL